MTKLEFEQKIKDVAYLNFEVERRNRTYDSSLPQAMAVATVQEYSVFAMYRCETDTSPPCYGADVYYEDSQGESHYMVLYSETTAVTGSYTPVAQFNY